MKDGLARRMATEANVQVRLEADPSGRYYVFSLRRQTWTFSIIYSHLSLDPYCSYICTFNLMAINVACVLNVKKSISVFKVDNTKIGLLNAMQDF